MEKVTKGDYYMNAPEFETVSQEAKTLIKKMMCKDVDKRVSAQEAINDDWFRKVMGSQENEVSFKNLANLKNFNSKSKLQQAVYYFIVNNMATKEEKNELIKTFKALDLNGDGK
jgi:calcium-dependent protein kinase